jgi:hypothetical protein
VLLEPRTLDSSLRSVSRKVSNGVLVSDEGELIVVGGTKDGLWSTDGVWRIADS